MSQRKNRFHTHRLSVLASLERMRISGKRIYIFGEDVTRIVKRLEAEGKIARIRIPALSPFGPHIKRTRLVDVNNNPYA